MGGPIVRTGTTPKFWQNWEQVFGNNKKSSKSQTKAAAKKPSTKAAAGKKTKKAAAKKKK